MDIYTSRSACVTTVEAVIRETRRWRTTEPWTAGEPLRTELVATNTTTTDSRVNQAEERRMH